MRLVMIWEDWKTNSMLDRKRTSEPVLQIHLQAQPHRRMQVEIPRNLDRVELVNRRRMVVADIANMPRRGAMVKEKRMTRVNTKRQRRSMGPTGDLYAHFTSMTPHISRRAKSTGKNILSAQLDRDLQ